MGKFVGREGELSRLKGLISKKSASFVVVRGRRRIGKSRLLAEFGKDMKSFFFSGIPPSRKTTAQSQREEFASQLSRANLPGIQSDDWGFLFWHLARETPKGRVLIVLDEISWMGGKDHDFLGKLKNAWDLYFSKNPSLILVVCGSVSSWIEENILSSTGFVGRITLDLVLDELAINECNAFWRKKGISHYEKLKLLSVTGGVPLYLEQIRPELTAEQNISALCFERGALLVREFDEIFSDLFSKKSQTYKEIVHALVKGPKELVRLCEEKEKSQGGTYTNYLNDLTQAGFVQRDFTWSIKTGRIGKLSHYRLSDNYLRFYLKYIEPNRPKIDKGTYSQYELPPLPNWESIMGLQFENLLIHNRRSLWELLSISSREIVMDGPYFQRPTTTQKGCQVDYMIQTRFNTLYVCEIKFSKKPLSQKVIEEVKEKINRIKVPRNCSIRPILIHVNGTEGSIEDADYFDTIIDFGKFLEKGAPA